MVVTVVVQLLGVIFVHINAAKFMHNQIVNVFLYFHYRCLLWLDASICITRTFRFVPVSVSSWDFRINFYLYSNVCFCVVMGRYWLFEIDIQNVDTIRYR